MKSMETKKRARERMEKERKKKKGKYWRSEIQYGAKNGLEADSRNKTMK